MFLKRIEAMAAAMVSSLYMCSVVNAQPETVLTDDRSSHGPVTTTSTANGSQAGVVNSATGAAGALAGWAIASIGKQMSNTEVHSTMSAAPTLAPPSFASNANSAVASPVASPRLSSDSFTFGSTSTKPSINVKKAAPRVTPSSSSGMKLGATKAKAPTSSLADTLAGEWDDADDGGVENAWGTDDLIDVNADEDDWAAFESAPVPEIVVPPAQSYYVKPATQPSQTNGTRASPAQAPAAPAPRVAQAAAKAVPMPAPVAVKPSPAPSQTPTVASNEEWGDVDAPAKSGTPQPSMAGMSKEEKDKEMARRREERKAVSLLWRRMSELTVANCRDEGAEEGQGVMITKTEIHRCSGFESVAMHRCTAHFASSRSLSRMMHIVGL